MLFGNCCLCPPTLLASDHDNQPSYVFKSLITLLYNKVQAKVGTFPGVTLPDGASRSKVPDWDLLYEQHHNLFL